MIKKIIKTSLLISMLLIITGCSDRDEKYMGIYQCPNDKIYHLNENGVWKLTSKFRGKTSITKDGHWYSDENYISLMDEEVVKDNDLEDMVYWDKKISNTDSDEWWIFGKSCTKVKYYNELAAKGSACDNIDTRYNVLKVAKQRILSEIGQQAFSKVTFSMDDIKVRKHNIDNGTYWCTAQLIGTDDIGKQSIDLTFSSEANSQNTYGSGGNVYFKKWDEN